MCFGDICVCFNFLFSSAQMEVYFDKIPLKERRRQGNVVKILQNPQFNLAFFKVEKKEKNFMGEQCEEG